MHTDAGDGDGPSTLHAGPQASRPAPLALRWCRAGCEGQPARSSARSPSSSVAPYAFKSGFDSFQTHGKVQKLERVSTCPSPSCPEGQPLP